MSSIFDRIPEHDRRTDRQTDRRTDRIATVYQYRAASVCWRAIKIHDGISNGGRFRLSCWQTYPQITDSTGNSTTSHAVAPPVVNMKSNVKQICMWYDLSLGPFMRKNIKISCFQTDERPTDRQTGWTNKQHIETRDQQEAQLSQRHRATFRIVEYFAKSPKATQAHSNEASKSIFHWYYVCILYRFWDIQRQKWRDLETGGRGRFRSLKMAPFDRAYTTFYWSAIVNIALGLFCTVFELFDVE